ncbi:hypothetical protein [Cryptosporangium sp. NPDC051539]|uniref:hypothetical protein n=1 Tax=Cryptosporangium sp. NPDC051539 TaxID=3363962 RepID=UPI0037A24B45
MTSAVPAADGEPLEAVPAAPGEPLSAEEQTRWHRQVWASRGRKLGLTISVPPCPCSDAELAALRDEGRAVAYLPHELSSHLTRDRFRAIFPAMDSYAEAPANGFVNTADAWGWFDYETARDAPRLDLDEPAVRAAVTAAGRTPLTLDQYIVASQDQHRLTGHHLDDRRTWTRLATSYDGRTIAARFDGDQPEEGREDEPPAPGSLLVAYDLTPSDHGRMLGVRTRSAAPPLRSLRDDLWTRTTDAYVRAGFPARLGTTPADYLAGLPRVPPDHAGRFDVPLVVEPRIPWPEQARLLGVRLSSHSRRFSFEAVEAAPDVPYLGWFAAWGSTPISSVDARARLAPDECGGTPIELLAMNAALPDLARTSRFFEAIGVVMNTSRCLGLYRWRGAPEIGANQYPIPYSMFRPLVRGRVVTTLERP